MKIGFNPLAHTFYEGFTELRGAHPLDSNITFTAATFIYNSDDKLTGVPESAAPNEYQLLFREDSFDPITRTRRGRFYRPDPSSSNPTNTPVSPSPGLEASTHHPAGIHVINKPLRIFIASKIVEKSHRPSNWPLVVLGLKDSPTFWKILQIEHISTGEELVYLRARSSLSALPDLALNNTSVSTNDLAEIKSKFDALLNDLHTSTANSIVDHCRDVAEVTLRAKIRQKDPTHTGGELDKLIKIFSEHFSGEHILVQHYSEIIRRFHQRRKTSSQDKINVRPILEEDAELTVYCISSMMRDLGLAKLDHN